MGPDPRPPSIDRVRHLLRPLWREPRPAPPVPEPVGRDRLLVGAVLALVALEWLLRPDLPWRDLSAAVLVGLAPTLRWRRRHPAAVAVGCFGISAVVTLATHGAALQLFTAAALLVLPYALVRWGSGPEVGVGATVVVLSALPGLAWARTAGDVVGGLLVLVVAFALGGAARYRARAGERALDRVRLLEREALARDLHDTVAHHVSAIAIRAQAGLATAATRPEAALEALAVIETEASRTLAEMRAMVRLLRDGGPSPTAPGPVAADLLGLASSDSRPAVVVRLDLPDDVPAPVQAALFRLAQEAVTNARRHAREATRIDVRVHADAGQVHLSVHDDGVEPLRRNGSPGFGLAGMAERARLLGGSFRAGPGRAGPGRAGGWTVSATLPLDVTAAGAARPAGPAGAARPAGPAGTASATGTANAAGRVNPAGPA